MIFLLLTVSLLYANMPWTAEPATRRASSFDLLYPVSDDFPYELDKPSKTYKLDDYLEEISGLSFMPDGRLACIQDEIGWLFVFDERRKDIIAGFHYADEGDYEAVEVRGKDAYVMRSDGKLYMIRNFSSLDPEIESLQTALDEDNDVEGLCLDRQREGLLIACKKDAGIGEKRKGKRAIYRFDLQQQQLERKPYLLIDLAALAEAAGKDEDDFKFEPSGLALHPRSGDLYIIASAGQRMAVFRSDGSLRYLVKLRAKDFKQPEGICFAPDGTLYLSNEGKGGRGNIMRFTYRGK